MNKDKVMAMIKKKSDESGVSVNTLLLLYFFEHFLDGIADSPYRTDLILKGGFLLSSIMGIETRTTMDMDISLRNQTMNEEAIADIFEHIAIASSKEELKYEITESMLRQVIRSLREQLNTATNQCLMSARRPKSFLTTWKQ